jgi:hypothetical protein
MEEWKHYHPMEFSRERRERRLFSELRLKAEGVSQKAAKGRDMRGDVLGLEKSERSGETDDGREPGSSPRLFTLLGLAQKLSVTGHGHHAGRVDEAVRLSVTDEG